MSTQPGPANPAISFSTAPEPYLDVKRAPSYLSVAVKTLNEWARLEKIPQEFHPTLCPIPLSSRPLHPGDGTHLCSCEEGRV